MAMDILPVIVTGDLAFMLLFLAAGFLMLLTYPQVPGLTLPKSKPGHFSFEVGSHALNF